MRRGAKPASSERSMRGGQAGVGRPGSSDSRPNFLVSIEVSLGLPGPTPLAARWVRGVRDIMTDVLPNRKECSRPGRRRTRAGRLAWLVADGGESPFLLMVPSGWSRFAGEPRGHPPGPGLRRTQPLPPGRPLVLKVDSWLFPRVAGVRWRTPGPSARTGVASDATPATRTPSRSQGRFLALLQGGRGSLANPGAIRPDRGCVGPPAPPQARTIRSRFSSTRLVALRVSTTSRACSTTHAQS